MTLFSRLKSLRRTKDATTNVGDFERLEVAYARQLDALQSVRREVVEAIAARKRLEAETIKLERAKSDLESRARSLAAAGNDELAHELMGRATQMETRTTELHRLVDDLREQGSALEVAATRIHGRIESFRLDMDALRARRLSADAHERARAVERALGPELEAARRDAKEAGRKATQAEAYARALAELRNEAGG